MALYKSSAKDEVHFAVFEWFFVIALKNILASVEKSLVNNWFIFVFWFFTLNYHVAAIKRIAKHAMDLALC